MRLPPLNARKTLVAFLIAAVPFLFLWDFLLLQKVFFYFDFEVQWIPIHEFVRTALAEGESVLWNPYVMLGFPQHAESQVGNFYPPNWLMHLLPRQEYGIALSMYIHLLIAFGSAYLLARACRLGTLPSIYAALCFAFSGFMFAQADNYNTVLVASYLPLKLLLLTWYFQRNNPRYLLYFTLLLGVELLVCHANLTFITTFASSVYFFLLALWRRQTVTRDLAFFTLGTLLAALVAAVQIVPTYELTTQSWRAGGMDYDSMTSFSLSFGQYLTSFFPMMYGVNSIGYNGQDYFQELYFYMSIFGLVLSLFGAWRLLQRRDNRYLAVIALVGATGLMLSLGSNNPIDIFRLLVHVPGFNLFRCPGRWSVLLTLGLAMLAGYGLQVLSEELKSGKRWRALLIMLGIALLLPLAIYGMSLRESLDNAALLDKITQPLNAYLDHLQPDERFMYTVLTRISPLAYLLCMIALLASIVAASALRLPAKYCALAIVAVSFLDLLFVIRPLHPRADPDFFLTRPWHIEYLQRNAGVFRATSSDEVPNLISVNNYSGAFHRIQSIKGYAPIKIRNYIRIEELLYQNRTDIMDYAGVKFEIVPNGDETFRVDERPGAFPRAFLLDRYAVAPDEGAAFETFANMGPEGWQSYAIIPAASAQALGLPETADIYGTEPGVEVRPVEITGYGHARVEMRAVTRQPAFLILTDMFYPGWRALVDGREVPIVPVQGVFRGVYLDAPGSFKVEMVYEPLSFKIGATCSMLGVMLLAAAGFWITRRWPRGYAIPTEAGRLRLPRRPLQTYRGRQPC